MRKITTVTLLIAFLAISAPAMGATVATPPGNSEADQYFESLPTTQGPRSPDTGRTPQDAVAEGALPGATARALESRGKDGQTVASIVAQTAPTPGGGEADAGGNDPGTANAAFELPDEEGMGILFPLILVATGAAALVFALDRRRRSPAR
jgi:hypothetical protein